MSVPKGYKRTEVGVIPEEWSTSTVGNEFHIQLGKMLDAEKNVGVPKPFLGNKSVQWGKIDVSELGTIKLTTSDIERFRLRNGDLLVCEGGEVGRAAIWQQQLEECYFQKALHRLRAKRGFPVELASYLLHRYATAGMLTDFVTQTSIAHLPKDKFEKLPIPVPPSSEQRAIAAALGDVDALLAALDAQIAKQRDLKQATMQQLLTGQTRLPGFQGEWSTKRLEELGTWKGGMTPSMQNPDFWVGGTIPWISSGDVKSTLLLDTSSHITDAAIQQGAITLLPKGAIILVTRSGILRKYLPVAMNLRPMAINQDIKALIPSERYSAQFLLHALTWRGDEILGRCMKSGTTVESVEFRWLKVFTLSVPPLTEQVAIASLLSDMDGQLTAFESRRAKTAALKQAMMQALLTGRIRLV